MTQFDHIIIANMLALATIILFRRVLFFPEEYAYHQRFFDRFLK